MRDVLPKIDHWLAEGKRVALATVVEVWGSAPRPLGSKMAISDAGDMAGSVSGGCVEGAVFEEAQEVIDRGLPKLLDFGVSDETAWSVGLSCGGHIGIWVEPLALAADAIRVGLHRKLHDCLDEERLVALVTVVEGVDLGAQLLIYSDGSTEGSLGSSELDRRVRERACELFALFASESLIVTHEGQESRIFIDVHPPRPNLIVVGAVHAAIPLISFAKILGLRTVVVDPRMAFATPERFGHADELHTTWPDEALRCIGLNEASYLALLSHDLKLDLPALEVALRSPARYVGALGSKKTHGKRISALREKGFSEQEIARIKNPIGLDLGGRRAEEIAVAILAEIVAVSHGRLMTSGRA